MQWNQEKNRQHEKLKQQKILEYETKQAEASKSGTLFKKSDKSSGTVLFRDSKDVKISIAKLREIKINIHRNISTIEPISEIERSIVNIEDIVLKRREGEGSKHIFDRK